MSAKSNIILIGMPGVGKSTAGVLLAKRLSMGFLDTDLAIQLAEGRRLQDILDSDGLDAFREIEERIVCSIRPERTVVATGGSVVYGQRAMRHLCGLGFAVWLDLAFGLLAARVLNLESRGVVMAPGMTLRELYDERRPLYAKWADAVLDCGGLDLEETVDALDCLSLSAGAGAP